MKKVLLMVLFSLGCLNANAAVELDQSFTDGRDSSFQSSGQAQTFVVGKSGILDHVSLGLFDTRSNTSFYLLPTIAGAPATDFSNPLAAVDLSDLDYFKETWTDIDLRSFNVSVKEGDELALALVGGVTWGGELLDTADYPDGKGYLMGFDTKTNKPVWNALDGKSDYHFQTFVEQPSNTVAPEPSTMFLLGGGLAGMFLRRNRKKA